MNLAMFKLLEIYRVKLYYLTKYILFNISPFLFPSFKYRDRQNQLVVLPISPLLLLIKIFYFYIYIEWRPALYSILKYSTNGVVITVKKTQALGQICLSNFDFNGSNFYYYFNPFKITIFGPQNYSFDR